MIITNLKVFEDVCSRMRRICKSSKNEYFYDNVLFMNKNLMCATDCKIIVIRNMSDCVINDEVFAFPIDVRYTKIATSDGEKIIIENRKEEWFSKEKKETCDYFNWKQFIPTEKPSVLKEYDFSKYEFRIPYEKNSVVTFHDDNSVTFDYMDYNETIGTYYDVVKNNDMFEDTKFYKKSKTARFYMKYIYFILKISKMFMYEEYENLEEVSFKTKNYQFIMMPFSHF